MKKDSEGNIIYSPSDLILFMESPFGSWMDRFYLEFPDELQPDKGDAGLTLLQDMGNEHEERYLKQLEQAGAQIANIPRKDSYEATVAAMRGGIQYIYQGELRSGNFAGRSDFLQRAVGKSDLGDYHYQVWDTKLSRKPKPYFLIQLCCYAELLESVQGVLPEVVGIVLGDGREKTFRTLNYLYYYRQLKETFLKTQAAFDRTKQPIPDGMADHRRWTSHAEKILDDLDHLSRVANIRRTPEEVVAVINHNLCQISGVIAHRNIFTDKAGKVHIHVSQALEVNAVLVACARLCYCQKQEV